MKNLDLETYSPKRAGTSDKFSWLLYRKMQSMTRKYGGFSILFDPQPYSRCDDSPKLVKKESTFAPQFFLTAPVKNDQTFTGMRLFTIMCNMKNHHTHYDLKKEYQDVTAWFLQEYKRQGLCLLDKNHSIYNHVGRYTQLSPKRQQCNWCGVKLKPEIVVSKETYWRPVAANLNF